MTASWDLKLNRAEQHFDELKSLIGFPTDRYNCPVTEVLKPNGDFEYAVSLGLTLDENIPVVAGDLLFNVRSALDHLLCALIPGQDKGRAQFPIFTTDPLEIDGTTGKYRDSHAHGAWMRDTKGVPSHAVAVLATLQPFEKTRQAGKQPDEAAHHFLAVLNTLQNADKHRQLIFSRPTLKKARIFGNGVEVGGLAPAMKDGAILATHPGKMNVKVDGFVAIPFGVGDNLGYEFPIMFEMILRFVKDEVIANLAPLVP